MYQCMGSVPSLIYGVHSKQPKLLICLLPLPSLFLYIIFLTGLWSIFILHTTHPLPCSICFWPNNLRWASPHLNAHLISQRTLMTQLKKVEDESLNFTQRTENGVVMMRLVVLILTFLETLSLLFALGAQAVEEIKWQRCWTSSALILCVYLVCPLKYRNPGGWEEVLPLSTKFLYADILFQTSDIPNSVYPR